MKPPWNPLLLRVFAPLLLVVGALGFVIPPALSLTSGATAYNLFHLAFGVLGLAAVRSKSLAVVRAFNVGFGAIDLYQAAASALGLWPQALFQWKPADDVLHVGVGALLLGVGLLADRSARR